MAPRAAYANDPNTVAWRGGAVAKEMVRGVVDFALKKKIDRGRRLGGSRFSSKKIEEGIKRVVEISIEKVEDAGGVGKFFKKGISRIKQEGIKKVAEEVMNFATLGLVKVVNPSGFAAVFKANGTCELVYRKDPLEGLGDPTLQMEDLLKESPRVKPCRPATLSSRAAMRTPVQPDVPTRSIDTLFHNSRLRFLKKEKDSVGSYAS